MTEVLKPGKIMKIIKIIKKTITVPVLTLLILLQFQPLIAQDYYPIMDITPYDIYGKVLGPVTQPIVLAGYLDRNTYHETRYVSVNSGSDTKGDGSKSAPWMTIRHALDQIDDARLSRRYALLVAGGTYTEGQIILKAFVHLYGGFQPESWERDIKANRTVMDGQRQNRLMVCADHSKVDGFIFTNGEVRGQGGAILCNGTSPVISNNVFVSNRTLIPDPWEPEFIHEIANDGGAIATINGAAPGIYSNLFIGNMTEAGRGGGIAAHNRAAPRIHYNVFMGNISGINDPMRSSDGGAISSSFYSNSDILFNLILNNRAQSRNDGGGIFSELWSSLHIGGNLIVGNTSDDDGGGIYLSGQVHHYITEHDPVVPQERYFNRVTGNILAGNSIPGRGIDGALRFTYHTRVAFHYNISYANTGGLDFRRSEVCARGNIVFGQVTVRESDHPAHFVNNLIFGDLDARSDVILQDTYVSSMAQSASQDADEKKSGFLAPEDIFLDDEKILDVRQAVYDADQFRTRMEVNEVPLAADGLRNRIVRIGDNWSVIQSNTSDSITLWGDHSQAKRVHIKPTYRHQ